MDMMADDDTTNSNDKNCKKRTREEENSKKQQQQQQQHQQQTNEEDGKIPKLQQNHRVVRQKSNDYPNATNTTKLSKLRLEAIFHPKFENEGQSSYDTSGSKRSKMLQKVQQKQGYIEVSLKHSGSLLLWSGGQGYYSKNSTGNVFTSVGEILLRQHFARAWWLDHEDKNESGERVDAVEEEKYNECSSYITTNRLTLAFEVVTSVLGHHGSLPHKDFSVLTAIADKSTQSFYSTTQVARFAQRFRLPHNDYWMFRTENMAKRLFDWYDEKREVVLASEICGDLDGISDGRRVKSLYPHAEFQGEIVEGIVVRYVPYASSQHKDNVGDVVMKDGNAKEEDNNKEEEEQTMNQLACESERILNLVPPERPPSFDLFSSSRNHVLSTDIRKLYESSGNSNNEAMERALSSILKHSDGERRIVHRLSSPKRSKQSTKGDEDDSIDVPTLVNDLLISNSHKQTKNYQNDDNIDKETLGIANLIQTLHSMNGPIEFKVIKEEMPLAKASSGVTSAIKWYCIIHVMQDSIFPRYMNKMNTTTDMMLYRGFCVRLIFKGEKDVNCCKNKNTIGDGTKAITSSTAKLDGGGSVTSPPLMLKMKFLPYMVRTFGCRNGLKTLEQTGVSGFEHYTMNLLTKWGMSSNAIAKWHPFFCAWGLYASEILQQQQQGKKAQRQGKKNSDDGDEDLPPLTGQNYLHYLERFNKLYEQGELGPKGINDDAQSKKSFTFRGVVVVVGLQQGESAAAADLLSKKLSCRRSSDVHKITEEDMHMAVSPVDGGLIINAVVEDGFGPLRRFGKKYGDMMHVILVGCDDDKIEASIDLPMKEKKRRKGMLIGWRKSKFKTLVDIPLSCFSVAPDDGTEKCDDGAVENLSSSSGNDIEELRELVEKLVASSDSIPKEDERPGALLFFPGIPGSGKSTLCSAVSTRSLCVKLGQMDAHMKGSDNEKASPSKKTGGKGEMEEQANGKFDRPVVVRVGDAVKEKYWPLVRRERSERKSSLYIADKNATPTVWSTISEICAESKGVFVPVLPDAAALSTTTLEFTAATDTVNKREYVFPFSLQYLAVCMSRVLQRPHKSHRGKLDAATPNACMVVVKFFCLYKGLTADRLKEVCGEMVDAAGAIRLGSEPFFLTVTFFNDDLPRDLPKDLHDALVDAVQLEIKEDSSGQTKGTTIKNEIEQRLRSLITSHADMLQTLTVSQEVSSESFLSQIAALTSSLDSCDLSEKPSAPANPEIKLVSIDVNATDVHRILKEAAALNSSISEFLDTAGEFDPLVIDEGEAKVARYIKDTHVTMAHRSRISQNNMRKLFGKLEGSELGVVVNGLLFSDDVAALSVVIPSKTLGNKPLDVPPCENEFAHITVWCGDGVSAVKSNDLPSMVMEGIAKKVEIQKTMSLHGVLRFWLDQAE